MAKKQQTDDTETVTETETTDPASPPAEPEKITTVEDLGIGAGDPYPTGKPAEPEVK